MDALPGAGSDHDLLVSISTKLDILLTTSTDHEIRLRKVERGLWLAGGVASALGVLAGVLTDHQVW